MELKQKRQIIAKLRTVSRWSPNRAEAIRLSESEDRNKYRCNKCRRWYRRKTIQVDHIIPVLDPVLGFPKLSDGSDDWTTYIARLFCPLANLQVLCKRCHSKKTKEENAIRKEAKANGTYQF
jgi:5-methylcytosine-specific restriction endonuclease McrA